MKYDPNDPRLTAYALNELDESEKAEVERILNTSPEARDYVKGIRETVETLTNELGQEPEPALDASRKGVILAGLNGNNRTRKPFLHGFLPGGFRFWRIAAVTVPLIIILGVFTMPSFLMKTERSEMRNQAVSVGYGRIPSVQYDPSDGTISYGNLAKTKVLYHDFYDERSQEEGKQDTLSTAVVRGSAPESKHLATLVLGEESKDRELGKSLMELGYFSVDVYDAGSAEAYDQIVENPFLWVPQNPVTTFSIDVDTASYANVRRILRQGSLPPKGAVRIEEMINYFSYDYPQPTGTDPFSVNVETAGCPWASNHRLVRIGLKGKTFNEGSRPASNLVFLIDVSGSMQAPNKLPLVKEALGLLVNQLTANDRVAMVVYAGSSGLVLESTSGDNKQKILGAVDLLQSGGSTHGSAGIQLAYETAAQSFIKDGINRVILATDGDFNVGVTNQSDLTDLIEEKAKSGVFLTALGFGMGNLKDSTLEKLADKGNGNYAYIDTINEARKVLVEEMSGTLVTIAKDVKIQVEWNPIKAGAYRLIGYENRMLQNQDFNDDTKDAGEIGAGHTVTALYEVALFGEEPEDLKVSDPLKYQKQIQVSEDAVSGELLTVKLRYKEPDGDTSKLLEFPITDEGARYEDASEDYKFAASVAAFGMILRDSKFKGNASPDMVLELAGESVGKDPYGYRAEFLQLVGSAKSMIK